MSEIDDFLSYGETVSEGDWIEHYTRRFRQHQGRPESEKMKRGRLLSTDPEGYPLAATVGGAIRECVPARPCGYPECPACRGRTNIRERERAAKQFRGVDPDRIRWLTVNLQVLPLNSRASAFKQTLAKAKKQLRGRLTRFWIPEREITAEDAGLRFIGYFEVTPIGMAGHGCLLFHFHAIVDMGTLAEEDVLAVFGRYSGDLSDGMHGAVSKRYDKLNRLDLARLHSNKTTEVNLKNLGGYGAKLSMKLPGDPDGRALRAVVEHLETVRKRGMEGLRFRFGFSKRRSAGRRGTTARLVCSDAGQKNTEVARDYSWVPEGFSKDHLMNMVIARY